MRGNLATSGLESFVADFLEAQPHAVVRSGLQFEHTTRRLVNTVSVARQTKTRAQLSLGLADRTRGAHSQPASIAVRV